MYLAASYGDDLAQYRAVEFTGTAADEMDIPERMCLSVQAVEMGAKFSFFSADQKTMRYVKARTDRAFEPANADPGADYERTIEVEIDRVPFLVSKPHHFRNAVPVGEVQGIKIDQAAVGSCANGRLEDMAIVSRILKGRKVAQGVRFLVSPASYDVFKDCLRAGILEDIVEAGGQVIAPGCDVCKAGAFLADGEVSISTAPRNHKGRMGSVHASIYLGGPATVAASAIAGEIVDPTEVLRGIGLV